MAAAIVFLAILFAWQVGQSAEKASKDAAPKGADKAMEKGTPSGAPKGSPGASASNATANAAKAFEKVSAELYPKAKQEGNLIIYSVWDVEHLRVITDAFVKKYPGIKTTYWQGRNPEIVTRVLTEFQGGQASVDSILSDNAPAVLRAAGAMASYETVQKDVLVLHDPTIPTVSLQVQALTYNTKKINLETCPRAGKTWLIPNIKEW